MTASIQGRHLLVPNIPAPMATNARLFVIARLTGRNIDEMRTIIWAKKPLRFTMADSNAFQKLVDLLASWGIRTQEESADQVPSEEAVPPVQDVPQVKAPFQSTVSLTQNPFPEASKEVPAEITPEISAETPKPTLRTGKPVLLRSRQPKGTKRFFLVTSARVSALFGLVMAIAIFLFFPVSGYILGFLGVPDQNVTDALAGWIAGALPTSIPALEVTYASPTTGSHAIGFFTSVAILVVLAIIAFIFRKSSAWFWLAGSLLFFHSSISLFGAHRLGLLFLAHTVELFFCTLFLFRAFSGTQVLFYSERAMYATAGWLLWLENLRFGWMLVQNGERLKPPYSLETLGFFDLVELGLAESLELLGTGLFTLNLAAPSIVLAIMIILELRRPQILIHRT